MRRSLLWTALCFAPLGFMGEEEAPPFHLDVEGAKSFNRSMQHLKGELKQAFERASALSKEGAKEEEYRSLLGEIRQIKREMGLLEEAWRKRAAEEGGAVEEGYALWDIGETTLSQLVMEYGGADFLYIIPQELSGMKISLFSSIPLPHESWGEMLEMILTQNGIGIRKLNPFVKQLYILKLDPSAIEAIVVDERDLTLFSNPTRLFFLFSPPPDQVRSVQGFLERFSDPKQTTIQPIGAKIGVVASKETIEKLVSLYHTIWEEGKGRVVRLASLTKIRPEEAEKILKGAFSDTGGKGGRPPFYPGGGDDLATLVLPQGLVLMGEEETVSRGEKILAGLEAQLDDPGEKVIYWYQCKHSNPEEVAAVLDKVYDSLVGSSFEKKEGGPPPPPAPPPPPTPLQELNPVQTFPATTAFNPVLPASAPFVQPGVIEKKETPNFQNFVVDQKTTSILMVVRREELAKIKALLKKLDVPKRMVQLDVLLVEKKLQDRKQVGFNLLQLGANASGVKQNSVTFDTREKTLNKGILSYIFSRPSGGAPAMDITYNFLLAQDDVRINANPSVLAINQTSATVSIVEEISINNGAIQLQTSGGVTVEQSYTRAQYGITIVLKPTIHLPDPEEGESKTGFVSLETNLEFDTTQISTSDRPPVTRRHVENQVRVADGETVILGGLRRKIEEDSREKIPFLGDLPGIGKLFGATKATDTNTEMFIFITPHIIHDPIDDLRCIRQSEYEKRAGDIPEFLERIDQAKERERNRLFQNSMKLLFDMY